MRRIFRPTYLLAAVYLLIICVAFAETKHSNQLGASVIVNTTALSGAGSLPDAFAASPNEQTISAPTGTSPRCTKTVLPNDGSTSQNARAPHLGFRFEREVYLITAAEMAAAGYFAGSSPTVIGFSYQTGNGASDSAPLIVYLENTPDTTNNKSSTWATAISPMTVVHNSITTLPAGTGPFDITLTGGSPFTYTGDGLYVAFDFGQFTGTLSTGAVVWCNANGLIGGLKGAQSNTSAPTTISSSNFRPETRLDTSCATPTASPTATATLPPTPTATATATSTATATGTASPTATATPPTATPQPTQPWLRVLWEGFDAVTAPALPPGWNTSSTVGPADCTGSGSCGSGSNWVTASGNSQTAPNAAFHDAPSCVTDSNLDTASIFIPNSINSVTLRFRHSYDLESSHDGGVLEISIEGGPFTDFVTAGGGSPGYNSQILTGFFSPIAGRQAWSGTSSGFVTVTANLPNVAKGRNVRLRFRLATDCAVGGTGWFIDNIEIFHFADPTPTATATFTAPAATPISTPSPTPTFVRLFWEGFDAVTPPSFPAGWQRVSSVGPANCTPSGDCGLISNWTTAAGPSQTSPNAAFHTAPTCVTDSDMDTPSISIPTSIFPSIVYFWHNYTFEAGHDGGVIEMSVDNGIFTDIIAAGGSFEQGGYTGTILTGFFSPIAGRQAWTGSSGGWVDSHVVLPNTTMGHNVRIRWRLATDCAVGSVGWYVDSIQVAYYFPDSSPTPTQTPNSPTPTATATATTTATATATFPPPTATATYTPFGITISGNVSYCTNPVPGPVPSVTLTLTPGGLIRVTDSSGNYSYTVASNGNYTVTPSKAARAPGSPNIDTVDIIAMQRHFLNLGTQLSGCRLTAADVNGINGVNTVDIIAVQRFFLGLSTGIANVGKYQFNPPNRTYNQPNSNQPNQNYDTLVFGDVASPFVE